MIELGMDKNILIRELIENSVYTKFFRDHKIPIPKLLISEARKNFQSSLENPKVKTYMKSLNSKELSYFYQVFKSSDIGKTIALCQISALNRTSKSFVEDIVINTRNFDKRLKLAQFFVPSNNSLKTKLESLGAQNSGVMLLALVKDGLDYLGSYEYDSNVQVKRLTKRNYKELVKLEYYAHKESLTTRCGGMSRSKYESFYKFCLKSKHSSIVLVENDIIIGTLIYDSSKPGVAFIMSIAVLPSEQNRGVAKLLYYEMLKDLKRKGIKVYFGVSTTTEVLGLAKKLKRKPVAHLLNLTINS